MTLKVDSCAIRLRLLLLLCVCLDAGEELVSGSGFLDVFDADVNALLHVSVSDLLVEDDADGGFGDVVDNAGLSVVDFVWHTLLDCTVADYVHDIADPGGSLVFIVLPFAIDAEFVLVLSEVDGCGDRTSLLEAAREGISGTRTETVMVSRCGR